MGQENDIRDSSQSTELKVKAVEESGELETASTHKTRFIAK